MKNILITLLLLTGFPALLRAQQPDSLLLASAKSSTLVSKDTSRDLFAKGRQDAQLHYKKYKAARNATFLSSVLVPFIGIIPAVISSDKGPKPENLGFPNAELMKSPDYASGYRQRAKQIKQKKIWTSWSLAFGINVAALVIIANR